MTWLHVKQSICKAAKNALGIYPKEVRKGWFDGECKDVLEMCNTACMKMSQRETRTNIPAYRNAKKKQN
jgi:hypothetical protein